MVKLIMELANEIDEKFCLSFVKAFGSVQIIPYTYNYCVAHKFEIKQNETLYLQVSDFIEKNSDIVRKALLIDSIGTHDYYVDELHTIDSIGLFSEIDPPLMLMGDKIKFNEKYWGRIPTI